MGRFRARPRGRHRTRLSNAEKRKDQQKHEHKTDDVDDRVHGPGPEKQFDIGAGLSTGPLSLHDERDDGQNNNDQTDDIDDGMHLLLRIFTLLPPFIRGGFDW